MDPLADHLGGFLKDGRRVLRRQVQQIAEHERCPHAVVEAIERLAQKTGDLGAGALGPFAGRNRSIAAGLRAGRRSMAAFSAIPYSQVLKLPAGREATSRYAERNVPRTTSSVSRAVAHMLRASR